jgi:hypothetical protein
MQIDVALKDWHAVCRAIERGRQVIMLRKGGIHETEGRFDIEHREFLLYPTFLHQKLDWVKPADRQGIESRMTEPDVVEIRSMARVTDIVRIGSREQVDAIASSHIYLPPLIDMRFNYKPQNPLYVLIVRGYSLCEPVTIQTTPLYAGCKSWVPLENKIDITNATPALSDADFERERQNVLSHCGHSKSG